MRKRLRGEFGAGGHARDFADALFAVERLHRHIGVFAGLFGDRPMMMSARGDLRQMGDAHHLPMRAEFAQFAPDHFGDFAADADIDFVED